MSVRDKFVGCFGEAEACAIERAAVEHGNDINDRNKGSDPFKWALLIAIGYQRMSADSYREYHQITSPWDELKLWIKQHAELGSHDGDCDYLCAVVGGYSEFIGASETVQ